MYLQLRMRQFERESAVECCIDPEVATTVTVDKTGVEPLQPVNKLKPTVLTANNNIFKRSLFRPMQHSATASAEPGKSGP